MGKNKKAWYLPGGKIDDGESSLETLQREIFEELNIVLNAERLKYYCHITRSGLWRRNPYYNGAGLLYLSIERKN
ncbi:NUDIX domain-containing protein [Macellibacteroides fermentans]|uniref:NUDIX domain-containing protein n=1 Tax=Macellibacteroides fermentans TaxID=879969 RepID=UPI00293BB676|nr:NUDIX domain-containing protein [Macellibacteroides fermentans]